MTPERWQQVKRVFHDASALDAGERGVFLDEACADDPELRSEVESLFESEERDVSIVDGDLFDVFGKLLAQGWHDDREGLRLGHYRILKEIGRGGMAAVYAAVRADDEFDQEVAIKLVRHGMESELMVARFRQERQILAHLDHPSIARLFDGGVTPDGLPYLVMEKIDGEPIDAFCDRRRLSVEERLGLFRTVCQAVDYAHRNLVIHRDLKPSNILVTSDGTPKLLDFGIAKLIEPEERGRETELTLDGPRPMTPDYASPEQVRGRPVTTASDVYALGVLLYRLLTGRRPYRITEKSRHEIERVICEQDPQRPSAVVVRDGSGADETPAPAELGRLRGAAPRELGRRLRGDLDNIVMKAMEKEPERRYGSADQLAEDVRRHLEGLPVRAHESTLPYRAGKFVRRHRIGVAAASLVFLSLVGGIVATTWQMRVAQKERLTAQSVSDFLVDLFKLSDPEKARGREIPARTLLERSVEDLDRLAGQPEVRATLMYNIGRVYLNLGMLDEAEPLLEDSLAIRLENLDGNDPAVADSKAGVGELLASRARYEPAERLLREALTLRRRKLDAADVRLARSENALGKLLLEVGRLDEAEPFLRQVLERQQRALGEEHQESVAALSNLALVLRKIGRGGEAAALYRKVLTISRKTLGGDHPWIATHLNNLALVTCETREHEEAKSLFEQALSLERRVLGEKHWSLATTESNLARCLRLMGDEGEAEALYRSALDLQRETLGPDHPNVAQTLNNLGRVLFDRREAEEAEKAFRESLRIYRRVTGGPHRETPQLLNNLAFVVQMRGELSEAEELYREALAMNRAQFGEVNEAVARNLANLGVLLKQRGDLEAAEGPLRQALSIYRRLFGEMHAEVAHNSQNLALLLQAMDRPAEAEPLFRDAVRLHLALRGDGDREVAKSLAGLGRALIDQKRADRAEPYLREAVAIFEAQPKGQRQPALAVSQSTLGRCLTSLGRYREAEALLAESHSYFEGTLGPDHRTTRKAWRWLAELRRKSSRADEEEAHDDAGGL